VPFAEVLDAIELRPRTEARPLATGVAPQATTRLARSIRWERAVFIGTERMTGFGPWKGPQAHMTSPVPIRRTITIRRLLQGKAPRPGWGTQHERPPCGGRKERSERVDPIYWTLAGNTNKNTERGNNFLGTADNILLIIQTNNTAAGKPSKGGA
jgi:hypothetical protein